MRLANVVEALTEAGDVDLFCTVSDRPDLTGSPPAPPGVARALIHPRAPYAPSRRDIPRWLRSGWPRSIAWRDWSGPAGALEGWRAAHYDLVWFSYVSTWAGLGAGETAPVIIDFVDLEDSKLRAVTRLSRRSRWRNLVDIGRWRRLQDRAAAAARAAVVCTDRDAHRLTGTRVVTIPNGYELQPATAPPSHGPGGPILTTIGLMTYPPNADGVRFFVRDVLPLVRRAVPSATFVIVGRHDSALDDLAREPGVDLRGPVPDLSGVLGATAAVVVPVRTGGGTRIKILEAWAHGLPVVSTTVGCDGIDAQDRAELLVGDTPSALAAACVRALTEPATAAAIGAAGQRRWLDQYQWKDIRTRVTALAREVGGG